MLGAAYDDSGLVVGMCDAMLLTAVGELAEYAAGMGWEINP